MSVPTAGRTRLAIVGATGMVGGSALRYALEHPAVSHVTAIGRRKLGIAHPKLEEVVHRDFADCSALAEPLSGQDAAVYCIGAYTGVVPDAVLRKITVDYTIEFHEAERDAEVRMHTAEIRTELAQWRRGRERLQNYQAEILRLARDRSRAAIASYGAGRGDLRLATDSLIQEINTQLEYVQLEGSVANAWASLYFLHDSEVSK